MEKNLTGKVAIVTGASRGIGRAIAVKLAQSGAKVVLNFVTSATAAQETLDEIQTFGGDAQLFKADVGSVHEIEELFSSALENFGKIDILVNNAGAVIYESLSGVSEEAFDKIFATNVKGTYFCCQAAAQHMSAGGSIVNLSSSVTSLMLPTYSVYAASKGAVDQITRHLSKELGPKQIRVNAVAPGPTDTELFRLGKSSEQITKLSQMSALGGLGQTSDIANAICFLAGDQSRWITGQIIKVNGGFA